MTFDYRPYIRSLLSFIDGKGIKLKPYPKVVLSHEKHEGVFVPTGHYDPNNNTIHLCVEGRHPKDVLRTLAHECIHHYQNLEGRLVGYNGDQIVNDRHLEKLEAEAYMKGNLIFRRWTETVGKNEK